MQTADDPADEAEVVQMAVRALTAAHHQAVAAGHPVVIVQGGVVVRLEPDGTRTELKKLPARQRMTLRRKSQSA